MLELFRQMWDTESLHQNLRDASIVTIFKKGKQAWQRQLPWNLSAIHSWKTLSKDSQLQVMHSHRTIPSREPVRPNHGTVDMIFAARQIQEKCRKQHQDLFMVLIGLKKPSTLFTGPLSRRSWAKWGVLTSWSTLAVFSMMGWKDLCWWMETTPKSLMWGP